MRCRSGKARWRTSTKVRTKFLRRTELESKLSSAVVGPAGGQLRTRFALWFTQLFRITLPSLRATKSRVVCVTGA
jgi:hypothetical protein